MQPFDVTPSAPHNMQNGPITVSDVSAHDLGIAMGAVTATGGVMVKFFYSRIQIKSKNSAENGKWETRLCIAKQPRADRSTVATGFISEDEAKRKFPKEYHHFTTNEEAPTTGTPLSELPGITLSQIGFLQIAGLRSIEDLAELSDDQAREVGFEAIRAHKLAKTWLDRATSEKETIDAADIRANFEQDIAERDRTNKALQEQLKAMKAQIEALQGVSGRQTTQMMPQGPSNFDGGEDLPDIDDMPNPMAEGPSSVDVDDEYDPLAD